MYLLGQDISVSVHKLRDDKHICVLHVMDSQRTQRATTGFGLLSEIGNQMSTEVELISKYEF